MKENKSKTFIYKNAHFSESTDSLKLLLQRALADNSTTGARREPLSPDTENPIWRLIGQYQTDENFLFGVLMRYEPGLNPTFILDDANATSVTIQQLATPSTEEGKRHELVDSMLFFGILDNHMVMMQSSSLRSDHLENHFAWLLRKSQKISETNRLLLLDKLPVGVEKKLTANPVRDFEISGDLENSDMPPTSGALGAPLTENSSGLLHFLKGLLAPDVSERLNLAKLTDANVKYCVRLRYKTSTTQEGQKFMNDLGAALRHAEGVSAKVSLEGGAIIKGKDFRLTGKVSISYLDGVPDPGTVFERMRRWLNEQVTSGEVSSC